MQKTFKLFLFVLLLSFVFVFAGCDFFKNKPNKPDDPKIVDEDPNKPNDPKTVEEPFKDVPSVIEVKVGEEMRLRLPEGATVAPDPAKPETSDAFGYLFSYDEDTKTIKGLREGETYITLFFGDDRTSCKVVIKEEGSDKPEPPKPPVSRYEKMNMADARKAKSGALVEVEGVVGFITNANGLKPNGFYLIDETGSIYVYSPEVASQLSIGNKIKIQAEKAYYVSEREKEFANKYNYSGSCQLKSATLLENDHGENEFSKEWIQKTTVSEILDRKDYEETTGNIYLVDAYINKVPGEGYINYYINDLDNKTGSYVYTSCNGKDFAYLDEFDGKICEIYLSPINYKSKDTGLICRFIPVKVCDKNYQLPAEEVCGYVLDYLVKPLFIDSANYTSNPKLKLITTASDDNLGFSDVKIDYASDSDLISFLDINMEKEMNIPGKEMNIAGNVKAIVTVTVTYQDFNKSETIEVAMQEMTDVPTETVADVIAAADDTKVTTKGIVLSSLVNRDGFYLLDDTGVIAVIFHDKEDLRRINLGDELIIAGIRSHKKKDPQAPHTGQSYIMDAVILANNYGNHQYSDELFDKTKTIQDLLEFKVDVDYTTQVFTVNAKIVAEVNPKYTNYKILAPDDEEKSLSLYCQSAKQYSFLEKFAGKEVTLEVMLCNWNDKKFYKACVISVSDGTEKIVNTLNFNK